MIFLSSVANFNSSFSSLLMCPVHVACIISFFYQSRPQAKCLAERCAWNGLTNGEMRNGDHSTLRIYPCVRNVTSQLQIEVTAWVFLFIAVPCARVNVLYVNVNLPTPVVKHLLVACQSPHNWEPLASVDVHIAQGTGLKTDISEREEIIRKTKDARWGVTQTDERECETESNAWPKGRHYAIC